MSHRAMTGGVGAFEPSQGHAELRRLVRQFAEEEVDPQALAYNREEKFNHSLFCKLGELGLLGVTVPEAYGGAAFDATAACIVHEELAAADPAFCLSYLAHSLLFVNNLARNGNHEQKLRFLPDACEGKLIGGMGMSEPGAGTDVLGMRAFATKDGSDFVLNGNAHRQAGSTGAHMLRQMILTDQGDGCPGTKMWITNGTLDGESTGDAFLVYARQAHVGKGGTDGYSLFLVEKGMDGFSMGQQIKDK